jgi:ankyrin repeat protein
LGKNSQPDINAQDCNDNWNTALYWTIEGNDLEVVNFLVSRGADSSIKSVDGKIPFNLAKELFTH